jgi:hypothetical protein
MVPCSTEVHLLIEIEANPFDILRARNRKGQIFLVYNWYNYKRKKLLPIYFLFFMGCFSRHEGEERGKEFCEISM